VKLRISCPRWVRLALLACTVVMLCSSLGVARLRRVNVALNPDDTPIKLLSIEDDVKIDYVDRIDSVVDYVNTTDRDVEALAITIVYFDAFDEQLCGTRVICTDGLAPGDGNGSRCIIVGPPGFVKTAVAFVSAVRFLDGEVWHADIALVLETASLHDELKFLDCPELLEIETEL